LEELKIKIVEEGAKRRGTDEERDKAEDRNIPKML
jgi:hypothetical protein